MDYKIKSVLITWGTGSLGVATKAKEKLGWVPKIKLSELVTDMMQSDLKLMHKDQYLKDGDHTVKNYFE